MIKIINTNNIKLPETNQSWRRATCSSLVDKLDINNPCNTSQADVDAIANAMDNQAEEYNMPKQAIISKQINAPQINIGKEDVAALMIKNYVEQNGGIILNNEKSKNNQLLLG